MRPTRRISRRAFIRLSGGAVLLALVERFQRPDGVQAAGWSRWSLPGQQFAGFETEPVAAGHPFSALSVAWSRPAGQTSGLSVDISLSQDGSGWSDWYTLRPDSHVPPGDGGLVHSPPLLYPGRYFKLRVDPASGIQPGDLFITAVDTNSYQPVRLQGEDPAPEPPPALIDGFIISRAGWGANEAWRYVNHDPQLQVAWTPRYEPVEKLVIHHTATEFGYDDPSAVVRAIYHYHAVILDWGDIGYNYLIDWAGNVYEGRYGGPGVVGGHALQYNPGSIGIALIGNYSLDGPSAAALNSLEQLYWSRAPFIDVTTATDWVDLGDVPNLSGHGDLMATECPGTYLHEVLPVFRGRLAGTGPVYLPRPVLLEDAQILDFTVNPVIAEPGEVVEFTATLTNGGKYDLVSQGPDAGHVYSEGDTYLDAGYPKVEGLHRLAIDINGDNEISSPYRWGLGDPLSRDEIRVVTGRVQMGGYGPRTVTVSVVKEFVRYYPTSFERRIHVLHPLTRPAVRSSDPAMLYEEVTQHNVPVLFRQYWLDHGGLMRFGYPLTEPFMEVSDTDGNEYLTQYFERARFEYHPEFAGSQYEVLLGHLGAERTAHRVDDYAFLPVSSTTDDEDIWYFPETGHTLSYRFLSYWLEHGGLQSFGYPISEKFDEYSATDGNYYLVQYFERNRFEYHPEVAKWEDQILLGHLGREILIDRGWLPGPEIVE